MLAVPLISLPEFKMFKKFDIPLAIKQLSLECIPSI